MKFGVALALVLFSVGSAHAEVVSLDCRYANSFAASSADRRPIKVELDTEAPSLSMISEGDTMASRTFLRLPQIDHEIFVRRFANGFVGAGWQDQSSFSFSFDGQFLTLSGQGGPGADLTTWVCS